jgi:hypothetical protein
MSRPQELMEQETGSETVVTARQGKQFTWSVKISRGDKSYNADEYKSEGICDTLDEMKNEMKNAKRFIRVILLDGV